MGDTNLSLWNVDLSGIVKAGKRWVLSSGAWGSGAVLPEWPEHWAAWLGERSNSACVKDVDIFAFGFVHIRNEIPTFGESSLTAIETISRRSPSDGQPKRHSWECSGPHGCRNPSQGSQREMRNEADQPIPTESLFIHFQKKCLTWIVLSTFLHPIKHKWESRGIQLSQHSEMRSK